MDGETLIGPDHPEGYHLDICHQVISILEIPVLITDCHMVCVQANTSFHETFDLSEEDVTGIPLKIVDKGLFNIDEFLLILEDLRTGDGYFGGIEFWLDLRGQGERLFSMSGSRIENPSLGQLLFLAMRDVTEERSAQKSQRENEEKYRALYRSSRDAIMMLAPPNWRFIEGNPATIGMFRCRDEAEFVSLGPWDLSPPFQPDGQRSSVKAGQMILQAMENGSNFFQWVHRRLDGEEFPATVLLTRIELEGGTLLQATVRESRCFEFADDHTANGESKLCSLLENIPTIAYRCAADEEWTMEFISHAVERITGYPASDFIGNRVRSFASIIHPDDRQAVAEAVRNGLDSCSPFTISYRLQKADGGISWVYEKGQGIFAEDGTLRFIDGTIFDDTDKKNRENEWGRQHIQLEELVRNRSAALRENEEKYRTVVEQSRDGIYIYSDDAFRFVNDSMCRLTGLSKDQLYSMSFLEIIHPEDRSRILEYSTRRADGKDVPSVYPVRVLGPDGRLVFTEASVRAITYHDRYAVLGMYRDISELKKKEDEQARLEKLESMGVLAGSIAHDFNNFLTVILGNMSLARRMVEPGSEVHELLISSEMASRSASELTAQLLSFSNGREPAMSEVRLEDILEEVIGLGLEVSGVTPEVLVPEDIWPISVDPEQIAHVVKNILENAAKFLPEDGILKLRACNHTVDLGGGGPLPPGYFVRLDIENDGPPIPDEYISRIFDPFFSTRDSGTGLGLATAHSIVTHHGGFIRAENLPGGGCRFSIYLPTENSGGFPEPPRREDMALNGERVLIMDDKAMVRGTVTALLEHLGYEVAAAKNGSEAVGLYLDSLHEGRPYNAVILDLTVPGGMGGKEAIRELKMIDPSIKAVVSSGYSNDSVMVEYRRHGFRGAVVKPYSLAKLATVMKEISRN